MTARGPFFWILYIYIVAVVAAAALLLVAALPEPRLNRGNTLIILAGILIPVAIDALEQVGLALVPGLSLTPILFVISGALYTWALLRGRLFTLFH